MVLRYVTVFGGGAASRTSASCAAAAPAGAGGLPARGASAPVGVESDPCVSGGLSPSYFALLVRIVGRGAVAFSGAGGAFPVVPHTTVPPASAPGRNCVPSHLVACPC